MTKKEKDEAVKLAVKAAGSTLRLLGNVIGCENFIKGTCTFEDGTTYRLTWEKINAK